MSIPLRSRLEATVLGAGITAARIRDLCQEAIQTGVGGVCVPPMFVTHCLAPLVEHGIRVVTVANFPFADQPAATVASAVRRAFRDGAKDVDVVAPLAWTMERDRLQFGSYARMLADLAEEHGGAVKLILETAALDEAAIEWATSHAIESGLVWVKTSTGFHSAGGASVEAVRAMARSGGGRARIKASGGIRSLETMLQMVDAGAERAGTSSATAILLDEATRVG